MSVKSDKVAEEMTRSVLTVSPKDRVGTAFTLMKTNNIRHLPVVRDGQVLGMLSDRDLLSCIGIVGGQLEIYDRAVDEIMAMRVETCKPDSRIGDIANRMVEHRIDAMPVVAANGKLTGIITSTDLLKLLRRREGVRDPEAFTIDELARHPERW